MRGKIKPSYNTYAYVWLRIHLGSKKMPVEIMEQTQFQHSFDGDFYWISVLIECTSKIVSKMILWNQ